MDIAQTDGQREIHGRSSFAAKRTNNRRGMHIFSIYVLCIFAFLSGLGVYLLRLEKAELMMLRNALSICGVL
jgi:hypothetical protein